MKGTHCLSAIAAAALTGCATQPFYGGPGAPQGVAMKADYRGILAATRKLSEGANMRDVQVVCPEASPDAISANSFAAAFGQALRATTPEATTEQQLNAAVSVAQSVASIGLRTQSIQLMRDGMVYNCILFLNSAISPEQAYRLQRRSQNFTLGLLAIEQLTGPIKAQQAALATGGGGGTGQADVSKEAAALASSQDKLGAAREAHTIARGELERLQRNLEQLRDANTKAQAAKKKAEEAAKGKPDDSPENKAEAQAVKDAQGAANAVQEKTDEVERKKIDVEKLKLAEQSAQQQVDIAQDDLQLAKSRVRAFTNATAVFGASGGSSVILTDKIAGSIVDIVRMVLYESGTGEECSFAIVRLQADPDSTSTVGWQQVFDSVCSKKEQEEAKKDPQVQRALQNATNIMRGTFSPKPPTQ